MRQFHTVKKNSRICHTTALLAQQVLVPVCLLHSTTSHRLIQLTFGITGSRVSRRDSGLSVPPRGSPSVPTLIISRNGGQLLDQPQPGNPGEGGVGNRLARKARKILKATTKKLHGH